MTAGSVWKIVVMVLAGGGLLAAQTVPSDWKVLRDEKGLCQIMLPPDWIVDKDNPGTASTKDYGMKGGLAVVLSDAYSKMAAMPESVRKMFGIEKMIENTDKRVFYTDKSGNVTNYNVSIPGKTGKCDVQLTAFPDITEALAKQIALSLGPVK